MEISKNYLDKNDPDMITLGENLKFLEGKLDSGQDQ